MLNHVYTALAAVSILSLAAPTPRAMVDDPQPISDVTIVPDALPALEQPAAEPEVTDWYAGCVAFAVAEGIANMEVCVTDWFPACMSMTLAHMGDEVRACQP